MRHKTIIFGILLAVTVCQSVSAQLWVDDCGIIYAGVEAGCVLIGLDHFGSWLVAGDLGSYGIGDRVRVSGMLDPYCYSICMEGGGCIHVESIGDCQSHICGDANGDNTIGVDDAVYLVDYIFRGGPPANPGCIGDANGDGTTSIADAVYLVSFVFKGGTTPVEDCCQ